MRPCSSIRSLSIWGILELLYVLHSAVAFYDCLHNATSSVNVTSSSLGSTFQENLNSVLLNLTNLASDGSKYMMASTGSGPDEVYAIFQCRGDQSVHDCSACVANATATLSESLCPSSLGARIQLDACYVRYDNQTFFTPDFNYVIGYCYGKTSDTTVLSAIESLMTKVTTQAPKDGGYASASSNNEYAVAQCLGYLNESECGNCLTSYNYRLACDSSLGEQVHLTSCYYRFEPYSFFTASAPPPMIEATPPMSSNVGGSKGSKTTIIIGSTIAGSVLAIAGLYLTVILCRQRMAKRRFYEVEVSSQSLFQPKARIFSLREVEAATQSFHPNNKLGEGGFGPVYKGSLPDGQRIAVKKLSLGSQQGRREFMNEVNIITTVQHRNLIKLLGCCVEGPEKMLIYEYLPNGSLDVILFGDANGTIALDWSTRHAIILGMARGLAYLHEESQVRIIHRDIKPSNILLDGQLNPVIGDFGLARLVSDDGSQISTQVAGTIGYLAPEYIVNGELTEKVDVFSFGVVALEVLTGMKNSLESTVEQVWKRYLEQRQLELVDPKLGGDFSVDDVNRAIHVALLCTQEIPHLRPSMSMVMLLLSGKSNVVDMPTKPAFVVAMGRWGGGASSSHSITSRDFSESPLRLGSQMRRDLWSVPSDIEPR